MKCTLLMLLALAGCFASSKSNGPRVLHGEASGDKVSLRVDGAMRGTSGAVTVVLESNADDAIAVDVRKIRLRDHQGKNYRVRAILDTRQQGVMSEGPDGALNIQAGRSEKFSVEFGPLPEGEEPLSLVLPTLFVYGIEGRQPLKAIHVPLKLSEVETGGGDAAFYDPFTQ